MLPPASATWTLPEAAHLLNRAGFGGSPAEVRAFHALGREKAVDSLLDPAEPLDAFPLPAWSGDAQVVADFKARAEERRMFQKDARTLSREDAEARRREVRQKVQREARERTQEAQQWWFGRMLATAAPLREKMTLFWHDHFATSIQKVREPALLVRQNDLFRRHAFGSARDLTQGVLLDPAMMLYLDTQSSKKGMPNENFAREVMELFSLGEGNYSEQDVREAARAFTGYQLNRSTGRVFHSKRQWDNGEKTVFGKTGAFTGADVINLIYTRRAASRFLAEKLWVYFATDSPPTAVIDDLADTLEKSSFQTGPVLREIFLSRGFYADAVRRSQIKCPVQYLIAQLKQLEITKPPAGFALNAGQQLGQVLFAPPNVAGWDWGKGWINTNTLLTRYNLAGFLTKGSEPEGPARDAGPMQMVAMKRSEQKRAARWKGPDYETLAPRPLREDPTALVDALIERFFQGPLPDKARATFIEYAEAKKGEILTNKETAELCHLMLSTPYYQLC